MHCDSRRQRRKNHPPPKFDCIFRFNIRYWRRLSPHLCNNVNIINSTSARDVKCQYASLLAKFAAAETAPQNSGVSVCAV